MRSAKLTGDRFDPREGFDPHYLREPRIARVWHSRAIARWKVERGARALTDGAAVAELPYKTEEWLLSEVLADAGETVVLEPASLRRLVARRAGELARELGVSGRRRRAAEPA
jgi:predicted DNA-binding transcriptional regulator YafY